MTAPVLVVPLPAMRPTPARRAPARARAVSIKMSVAPRPHPVTLLAERHEDDPSYTALGTPCPVLNALRLCWPAQARPPGASLHAKIIVVDDQVALVGSANLTSRAMESNLECGILIRGGPQPRAIRDHISGLYAAGILLRL
jgi:cardiolipin synthase A/B